MNGDTVFFICELVGTVAFAISGVITSIEKKLDIFGALVLGTVTSIGGGILRENEYRCNGTALYFERLNTDWPTNWFEMDKSRFLGNGIDLYNNLGRDIPAPEGYYADLLNGTESPRECRVITE